MKSYVLSCLFVAMGALPLMSQVQISGTVTDNKGNALVGANVYLEGTYDGASTDVEGNFLFKTAEQGKQNLVASYLGYEKFTHGISLSGHALNVDIRLVEDVNQMDPVVITAGVFEASDEKKRGYS